MRYNSVTGAILGHKGESLPKLLQIIQVKDRHVAHMSELIDIHEAL